MRAAFMATAIRAGRAWEAALGQPMEGGGKIGRCWDHAPGIALPRNDARSPPQKCHESWTTTCCDITSFGCSLPEATVSEVLLGGRLPEVLQESICNRTGGWGLPYQILVHQSHWHLHLH